MSLDVENLYTNVPIERTIEIILDHVYHNDARAPPNMSETIMKQLLTICTKEAPFKHIDGNIHQQTDGIAMGSPVGCIFANFYMSSLEIQTLNELNKKPELYARYIDDILLVVDDENELLTIKNKLTENSVLSFTHEHGHNKLAFLEVLLEMQDGNLQTSDYVKPTNSGEIINYKSECSEKYKKVVITNLLHTEDTNHHPI